MKNSLKMAALAGAVLASSASATESIRVGLQSGTTYLPVVVAIEKGFYRQAGGNVPVELFVSTTNPLMESLAKGEIQAAGLGAPSTLRAHDMTDGRVRVLSGLQKQPTLLFCKREAGISSLRDIKPEHVIASPGADAIQTWNVRALARETFGDATAVNPNFKSMPHPEAWVAMESAEHAGVDCVATSAPFAERYSANGNRYVRIMFSPNLKSPTGGLLGSGKTFVTLAADGDWCEADQRSCSALRESVVAAMTWLGRSENRAEAAQIFMKHEIGKSFNDQGRAEAAVLAAVIENSPEPNCHEGSVVCSNRGFELAGMGDFAGFLFAAGAIRRLPISGELAPFSTTDDPTLAPDDRQRQRWERRVTLNIGLNLIDKVASR